mmetsp:Transcript_8245/g.18835  ORF Transcript_8245/g.18835 Transcript_8245/m.18835 type:complete len:299 (-) Transcript_8245:216-1112(-)
MDEEVLAKTGAELFKELLRVYPVAEVEDYNKNGVWRDDMMKTDLQLIDAHRREAGAPDAVPLEEVVMPHLPKAAAPFVGMTATTGVRPMMPGIIPSGLVKPTVTTLGAAGAKAATGAAPGGAAAELQLIALFVAKHKLEASKTKMMLAKLDPPSRRRYVIEKFVTKAGVAPMMALEQFIAQCEKSNSWGGATTTSTTPTIRPVVPAKPFVAPAAATGVKRPITPVSFMDPSKKPRIGLPASLSTPAKPAMPAKPATPGAIRPAGAIRPVGTIRPVAPKANAKAGGQPGTLIRNLLQRF